MIEVGVMEKDLTLLRRDAAAAGRALMANNLSYEQFMQRFADCEDDLVSDLIYLLEHEPQRGGVFGVNETEWAEYQARLIAAINVLE